MPTFECKPCGLIIRCQTELDNHINGSAHLKRLRLNKRVNYFAKCELCNFISMYASDAKRHVNGKRHKFFIENKDLKPDKKMAKKLIDTRNKNWISKKICKGRIEDKRYGRVNDNEITKVDVEALVISQGNMCCYCTNEMTRPNAGFNKKKKPDPKQITIERKDNDIAHTKINCVLACLSCNRRRKDRHTHKEFQDLIIEEAFN